jgi:hypothetical protein
MRGRALALAILLLLGLRPAFGKKFIAPFDLDDISWSATHVALVKLDTPSGQPQLLAWWRTDLAPTTSLDLAAIGRELEPLRSGPIWQGRCPTRSRIEGDRVALFLRRTQDGWSLVGGALYATVWFQGDRAYAPRWEGGFNPLGKNETALRAVLADFDRRKADFQATLSIADPGSRATTLLRWLACEHETARWDARTALRGCGEAAGPAIRAALRRHAILARHSSLLRTLVELDLEEDVKLATRDLLDEELAFWKKTSPTLATGFEDGVGLVGEEELLYLAAHLDRLATAVEIGSRDQACAPRLHALAELFSRNRALALGAGNVCRALKLPQPVER